MAKQLVRLLQLAFPVNDGLILAETIGGELKAMMESQGLTLPASSEFAQTFNLFFPNTL